MELVYIYHSGFALLGDGYTVIMDYYRDTEDKQAEAALRRLMNEQPEEPVVAPEQGKVHDELLHRPGKLWPVIFIQIISIRKYWTGKHSDQTLSISFRRIF